MRKIIPKNATMIPEHATCVFKGVHNNVYQWQQELFDGSMATYEMLKSHDNVTVIVVHEGKLLVIDEENVHGTSIIDFPGGRHDNEEEDELQAAQRELREETGYVCRNWKLINVRQPGTRAERFFYLFLATDVEQVVKATLDPGERITPMLMGLEEVKEEIKKGGFRGADLRVVENASSVEDILNLSEYP